VAFVLVISGILMIVTGAKGTYAAFGSQLAGDFTGDHNFTYWLAAIGGVGAVGYVPSLQTASRYFMALIIISMVLANKGFFAKFTAALKAGPVAPAGGTGLPAASTGTVSSSSSTATVDSAIKTNQSGAFGQPPETAGQAKFNSWMSYFLGTGVKAAP
jgi:hypothetical protein